MVQSYHQGLNGPRGLLLQCRVYLRLLDIIFVTKMKHNKGSHKKRSFYGQADRKGGGSKQM